MSSSLLPEQLEPLPLEELVGLPPSVENLERYEYRSISEDSEDFRVVTIHPGENAQEIHCTISHTSFRVDSQEFNIEYEALSYTWGSNVKSHAIIFNERILPVTENLLAALRRFRLHDKPRTLWVDAICINQDDIPERNRQVQSMARIYQGSKRVLVWLGEEDETTPDALSCINLFSESYWADKGGAIPQDRSANEEFFSKLMPSPACTVNWQAVSSLLGRPWFSRAWVIQEAILAPEALMVCGSHSCNWTTLNLMLEYIKLSDIEAYCLMGNHRQARLLGDLRETWNDSPEELPILSLFGLLMLTPEFLCQDPRDRVFSLMGLVPNKTSSAVKIDYSVSCRELYMSVARRVMETESDIRWLLLSQAPHEKPSNFNLPSWVPDWSLGAQGTPGSSLIGSGFSAGGNQPDVVAIAPGSDLLSFRGVIFDTVNILGDFFKIQNETSKVILPRLESLEAAITWMTSGAKGISEIEQIRSLADPYPTGEESLDVISQMLVGANTKSPKWIPDVLPHRKCYDTLRYLSENVEEIAAERFESLDKERLEFLLSHESMAYCSRMGEVSVDKEIGISQKGFLGWLPSSAMRGDFICVPLGCGVPYVLRKDRDEYYKLLGECYFHCIMHGEALRVGDLVECEFKLR
jgi:hypothetical protein